MKKLLLVLAIVGLLDSGYLVIEHYSQVTPPCTTHLSLVDCGVVLRSKYAMMFGIPLALLGLGHYLLLLTWFISGERENNSWARYLTTIESTGGAIFSIYLVYLQLGVIHAICLYCMLSALVSWVIFIIILREYSEQRKRIVIGLARVFYKYIAKPIFFLVDPEIVHIGIMRLGETSASIPGIKGLEKCLIKENIPALVQNVCGIEFNQPIGLAAGFDYEARLTQTLAPLGFGFQTVGTITNLPWQGNAKPRLGRLPLSRSLMVNKGFRNPGADFVIAKLKNKSFEIPVGISVGDAKGSIKEIIEAFEKFEQAKLNNSYYELNISCPNLQEAISFYKPKNLASLLTAVDSLNIARPIWVKMPISMPDKEILLILDVVSNHCPKAVIIGNLQKNRSDPSFVADEVKMFPVGNFSGKPTFNRSNQLIKLTSLHFKKRFVIVGCGGVFDAHDAYLKIKLGANLVQMISGMIYQGPQVIADINFGVNDLLKQEGLNNISEAVGIR